MTTVVVDQGDIERILAEAEVGVVPDVPDPRVTNLTKKPEAKPKEEVKVEAKAETKTEGENADDIEDEKGLTPRQKREYTESMLKSLAKKHAKQKSAEEFATDQYNTRRLAEQRAELLERENQRLKQAQIKVEPIKEPVAPKREDFKTDADFADAQIDWKVDQKLAAKQAEEREHAEQARQAEVVAQANARIERAIETVPDFKEVTDACDWETPPYIASYMQESDMFGELGYFLAKPEQAELRAKLTKMRPEAALVEIGKIESKLSPFAKSDKTETKVENGHDSGKSKSSNGITPSTEAQASDTGKSPSRSRAAVIKPLTTGSSAQVERTPANAQEALETWQAKRGVNLTRRQRH